MNPDELAEWVTASCERHGVPLKVADARVISGVAALMAGHAASTGAGAPAPAPLLRLVGSEPPDRINPAPVQPSGTRHTGADDNVIEYRRHDGVPAIQVEVSPLLA